MIECSKRAVADLPRISIVMPCLNGERFIRDAINSILGQGYPDLECVVVDACSTDGTLDILARFPQVTVVSEPDEGAHDALNKGVARAKGEVIGFLAVDDLYPDGALLDVGRRFAERPDADVVVGHSFVFQEDQLGGRSWVAKRAHARDGGMWLPELTFGVPGFFGCFFRRSVFEHVGEFDNAYTFAGDRHFLIRAALAGQQSVRVDRPTIYYRMHPSSQTINPEMKNILAMSEEYVRMSREFAVAPQASPSDRQIFRAWHAFESVKLALRMFLRGRLAEGFRLMLNLFSADGGWLSSLIRGLTFRREIKMLDVEHN